MRVGPGTTVTQVLDKIESVTVFGKIEQGESIARQQKEEDSMS